MEKRERVMKGLESCIKAIEDCECTDNCPYESQCWYGTDGTMYLDLMRDALELLKAQEPRVMTLEEVVKHYSLPPVVLDDIDLQEDYLQDIEPLYFDFQVDDPWAVHWRGYQQVMKYDDWKASYGQKWRCWTSRPSDEQREATPWE